MRPGGLARSMRYPLPIGGEAYTSLSAAFDLDDAWVDHARGERVRIEVSDGNAELSVIRCVGGDAPLLALTCTAERCAVFLGAAQVDLGLRVFRGGG